MKAPDKIYIEQKAVMYDMVNTKQCKPDDYEYIRKDALLDWIKAQLKENAEWQEVNPDDRFFGGKEVAFERLIDKINSLGTSASKKEEKK